MIITRFDHLAVAAASLADGVAWLRDRLGVTPPAGGQHARMGTHNHLLRLGPGRYLEVIAVDPGAVPPERPRWFGLDDPALRAHLAEGPRLVGWIARTTGIAHTAARSPVPLGPPEPMQRGELRWQITIRSDGSLPEGGALPSLIEWPAERPHPAESMPELGCRLVGFEIGHPERARIENTLAAIGFDDESGLVRVVDAPQISLTALVDTPQGRRALTRRTA